MVVEEQGVVGEGRHGDAYLGQIVQILQDWRLEEKPGIMAYNCLCSCHSAYTVNSLLLAGINVGVF